jgi:hypothetical protein
MNIFINLKIAETMTQQQQKSSSVSFSRTRLEHYREESDIGEPESLALAYFDSWLLWSNGPKTQLLK